MKKINWDSYTSEYCHSFLGDISDKTMRDHARWYTSWINRIERELKISFANKRIFEIGSGYGGVLMLMQEKMLRLKEAISHGLSLKKLHY